MFQGDNFQSANSESAILSLSAEDRVLCDCNSSAKIVRSWPRENPGVDSLLAEGVELEVGMRIATSFISLMWRNHMDGIIFLYWKLGK
ncbi:unnamed protein product [Brassica rapa]|uniref:Uncharacterized protein n=1 Tax=Brassica campestris TaxID=3711 RepID=A0A3P5ZN01_BRACM|nr:unnamed protein product [Brassica rapa]VDC75893.1 unnamed protein product [Brassica rapa]